MKQYNRLTNAGLLLTSAFLLLASPAARAGLDNVNIIDPRPITLAGGTHALPVTVVSGTIGSTTSGAANEVNSQITTSTTASTLIIARPTRVGCLIKNLDAAITVYIGKATVTAGNGMPLKPGDSVVVSAQILWQVIAASGTPIVAVADEYN